MHPFSNDRGAMPPATMSPEAERQLDLALIELRHLTERDRDAMMTAWLLMMGIGETHD